MISIEALYQQSASSRELVLPLDLAAHAIAALEVAGTPATGWEGWLRYADGRLGHSGRHQGTAGGSWSRASLERTMLEAQAAHDSNPEVPASALLFCIAHGA